MVTPISKFHSSSKVQGAAMPLPPSSLRSPSQPSAGQPSRVSRGQGSKPKPDVEHEETPASFRPTLQLPQQTRGAGAMMDQPQTIAEQLPAAIQVTPNSNDTFISHMPRLPIVQGLVSASSSRHVFLPTRNTNQPPSLQIRTVSNPEREHRSAFHNPARLRAQLDHQSEVSQRSFHYYGHPNDGTTPIVNPSSRSSSSSSSLPTQPTTDTHELCTTKPSFVTQPVRRFKPKRRSSEQFPASITNKRMKSTECILFAAALLEAADHVGDEQQLKEVVQHMDGCLDEHGEEVPVSVSSRSTSSSSSPPVPQATTVPKPTPAPPKPKYKQRPKPLPKSLKKKRRLESPGTNTQPRMPSDDHEEEQPKIQPTGKRKDKASKDLKQAHRQPPNPKQEQEEHNNTNENGDDDDANTTVSDPQDNDVLCGRGGFINRHPGNIVYRKVVDHNKIFYQKVQKKYRILVSQSIVQSILNHGGRFLMSRNRHWLPIDFKRAVQKTSQALRERNTGTAMQEVEPEVGVTA